MNRSVARLLCRIVPNARRSEVAGMMDDGKTLRIRIHAPAVEGKANRELTRFLAGQLGVSRRDVVIVAGEKSRGKRVEVAGMSTVDALGKLVD